MAGTCSAFKCWNCDRENCCVSICKEPKNWARIDAKKKKFYTDRGLPIPAGRKWTDDQEKAVKVPEEAIKASEEASASAEASASEEASDHWPPPQSSTAQGADIITCHRSAIEERVSDYECNSLGPNVECMRTLLRNLFLK